MREEHKNEEAVFNAAIKIESPAERTAFVQSACGDDNALLARVEALLKVHFEDKSFLKSPPPGIASTLDASPLTECPGTKIGRYKLLQLIGEGGFGAVYMAEQEEPIRRKVALKIIKLGMDTKQVIARFEAERQALAMMDHPNIARVFDAGATDTGRPYFVMELVKGIPITEYCDKNNLDTRQRLALFIDVCKAVHHAHQKGIIHRDIKPSNVMITLHDGKAVPKIIDFGIAKATEHRLTEKTYFTEYRQFIGTPEYMSPEQAEMSGLGVDTRTDIYSLGVLLYELLTGTTPFEAKQLRSAAYDEIRRIIREEEPPKPSTRLSTLGDALTEVAKHRQAEPDRLCKIVRGDLDWVAMKALEKDRTRRYETANELAIDIVRHLCDEPVSAGPPSRVYRMKKFVRRNRAMVTGVAVVLVVLVAGIVVSTIFAIGQARARAEAQAVADFLKIDVLASVDPEATKGREVTVRYILDAAAKKVYKKLKGMPLVEASIRHTLGITYYSIGEYRSAQAHLERALQIRRKQLGDEDSDTLDSMGELGWCYLLQGRYNEAENLFVKKLEIGRRVYGEEDKSTLSSMHMLGHVYNMQGHYDKAEPLLVKALEVRRHVLGEEHADTLGTMNNLALVYQDQKRYNEAEQLFVKTLEVMRRVLGEEHPFSLNAMCNLASLYAIQKRYDEAEQLQVKVLELMRRVLGQEHPYTLNSMGNLAILYTEQKRYDEAERLLLESLEIRRRILGEEHPYTLTTIYRLGHVYHEQGRFAEAEPLYVKTLEIERRVLGEEHPDTLQTMNSLGWVYYYQGRYDEAESLFVKVLEVRRRVMGKEHPDTLNSMGNLAGIYIEEEKYDEAERLYIENLEIRRRVLGEEHPDTLGTMNSLAVLYHRLGHFDEAEPLFVKVLEVRNRLLGEGHPDTLSSIKELAYLAWMQATCPNTELRDGAKAAKNATKVCELTNWKNHSYLSTLAAAYAEVGDFASAVKRQKEAIDLLLEDERFMWEANYKKRLKLYENDKPYTRQEHLVGWWKFDEGSGTATRDSSDNGYDGRLNNMDESSWVDGLIGGALKFDGVDDCVTIPALCLYSDTLTITAWIKRDGQQADSYTGIVYCRDGTTMAGISFGGTADFKINNELAYNWNEDTSAWNWHSGLIIPDKKWVFVAMVVEPTKATLYLGEDERLSSATNTINHHIEEFDGITHIGYDRHTGMRYFKGLIDDVRIYRYALSEAEVKDLYAGKDPSPRID